MSSTFKKNDDVSMRWHLYPDKQKPSLLPNVISIGDSIWYSTTHKSIYDDTENGMVQFCTQTNRIISIIEYPQGFTPCRHYCCKYNNMIYLIDGEHGEVISFNPDNKTYTKKLNIPKIGAYLSCVVLKDKIHIFHGNENTKHYVYDPRKNTLTTLPATTNDLHYVPAVAYQNQLIKFNGCDSALDRYSEFFIKKESDAKWTKKPIWNFPFPCVCSGVILYRHYIIIFGGDNGTQYLDCIYLLNLNTDDGWIKLDHITCPIPSRYLAVLTPDNHVHLFTELNKWPNWKDSNRGHYSIPLKDLMGKYYPFRFDLSVLKDIDSETRDIVYGYFRMQQNQIEQIVPNEVIDVCLLYYFD